MDKQTAMLSLVLTLLMAVALGVSVSKGASDGGIILIGFVTGGFALYVLAYIFYSQAPAD